jgi:peptidoglycan/LPS O-acetylase OafA/YrhL
LLQNNRIFGLDVLRAYAIFCVVYGHGYYLIEYSFNDKTLIKNIYLYPILDGVSIFFVLSGFLIGRILLRTVTKEKFDFMMLLEFYIRRWFRTLPNYFFILLFLIVANILLEKESPKYILRYLTFTQNMSSPHPDFFPEAWSLAVEEWFYLCVPIPLYVACKFNLNRRRAILFLIIFVILFSVSFRAYRVLNHNYLDINEWDISLRKQVITRLDSLMFGVFSAYISMYYKIYWNIKAQNISLFIGLVLLLSHKIFLYILNKDMYMFYLNYFSLSITPAGVFLILPKFSSWRREHGFFVKIITFTSVISYSMYLINLTCVQELILPRVIAWIMHYLWRLEEHRFFIQYFMYWLITISCSWLIYAFYEKPMTNLRDRFSVHGHHILNAFSNFSGHIKKVW